jgi:hypothetical protein
MKRIDLNQRLEILGQLVVRPYDTWDRIGKSTKGTEKFQLRFFLPAIGLFGLLEMLGMLLSTLDYSGPNWFIVSFSFGIVLSLYASYRLSVWLIQLLLKSFDVKDKDELIYRLLGLPLILGYLPIAVSALFRSMLFLILLSIYAFAIFWIGTQRLIPLDKEKRQIFGVLAILFSVASHVLVFIVLMAIKKPIIGLF